MPKDETTASRQQTRRFQIRARIGELLADREPPEQQ